MKRVFWALGAALLVLGVVSCRPAAAGITVSDAWARPSWVGEEEHEHDHKHDDKAHSHTHLISAAYLVIRNRGQQADRLLEASTPVAGKVEIHETRREGDKVRMVPVAGVEVPAGGTVRMAPGGLHIHLLDLKRNLRPGDSFTMTLRFERAGAITITVSVRETDKVPVGAGY